MYAQLGSGPVLQSAVWQHAAFSCPDIVPTASAHSSAPPPPSWDWARCAKQSSSSSSIAKEGMVGTAPLRIAPTSLARRAGHGRARRANAAARLASSPHP
eukprot:COSAG02_NODE_48847_length_331_cov_0.659483_1_plen_99_part_10